MDERNVHRIQKHLQSEEAQQRIEQNISRAREDATVTIGRAAQLFGFSESQLRDWENRGLLNPRRSKEGGGQRQYALKELDKLALIREFLNEGYSPSDIPPNIDTIWHSIYLPHEFSRDGRAHEDPTRHLFIDQRVEQANKAEFWRYYVSQTLRVALNLICEDIPDTVAGIILPLKRKRVATEDYEPRDLESLDQCLIGWRDQNRTFHTFCDSAPAFEYPSDFRVRGLRASGEEEEPKDRTFLVLQRRTRHLNLPLSVVETVRRLLVPIYESVDEWLPYFEREIREITYPTTALGSVYSTDSLLKFFTEMVVRLGEKNAEGKDRWKFCCVLLPRNPQLPLQMRTLVVQAQSERSPHIVDKTSVLPDAPILSLTLRAFQCGHIIYRPLVSTEDQTIVYREQESPISSAIAVPVNGDNGLPIAVLYVVSEEANAFDEEYQRVLRMVGRMVGELLSVTHVRQQSEVRLRDMMMRPRSVISALEGFDSENKLIADVGSLLRSIRETNNPSVEGVTSFISIDVDNLSDLTNAYGDHMLINLSKVLGDRIKDQAGVLFGKQTDWQIYHVYADRFCLFLRDKTLEQARESAEKLRLALQGSYNVSIVPTSLDQPRGKVELEKITVRLGVSSYKHSKFYQLMQRFPAETQIEDVIFSSVLYYFDVALNMGKQEGGNIIISHYPPEPPYMHSRLARWVPPSSEAKGKEP